MQQEESLESICSFIDDKYNSFQLENINKKKFNFKNKNKKKCKNKNLKINEKKLNHASTQTSSTQLFNKNFCCQTLVKTNNNTTQTRKY